MASTDGVLRPLPVHSTSPIRFGYEQVASQGFRSVAGALSTIAGYEAMNIIRKGQIRWLPKGDAAGQKRFVEHMFGIAA
jgi:hypothetical protein